MDEPLYRCPNGCGIVIEPFWRYCPGCNKQVPLEVYEKLLLTKTPAEPAVQAIFRQALFTIARRGCENARAGLISCIAHNADPRQRITLCSECVATAALDPETLAQARLAEPSPAPELAVCETRYLADGEPSKPIPCQNPVEEGEAHCNVCRDFRNTIVDLASSKARIHRENAVVTDNIEYMQTELRRFQEKLAVYISIRPSVIAFAVIMEQKLRENDHKGGWKNEIPEYLIGRLREEVGEIESFGGRILAAFLRNAERPKDPHHKSASADAIGLECADVANFAMMIADNAGALKDPVP